MIPSLTDLDLKDKRVLIRLDLDVPFSEGHIIDDTRLKRAIPTIRQIFSQGARQLIIMGHRGRPGGKIVHDLSTLPVAEHFSHLLGETVTHLPECIDVTVPPRRIILLENLRFHAGEESNDPEFARQLASLGEVYVNDAFATCHRAHASMVGVAKLLPGCIGLVVSEELKNLNLEHPKEPFVIILGGAKLHTKLGLISALRKRANHLLLGGAMIFTLYKAAGYEVGTSLVDEKSLDLAKELLNDEHIILPTDVVVAPNPQEGEKAVYVAANQMPTDLQGLDIGPASVKRFSEIIATANTIVWNGPLGYVEEEPFERSTITLLKNVGKRTAEGAITIIGGGDSGKMVQKFGLTDLFTHVSTGGGASMVLMEGKELVAIAALQR